ncbi:MAG: histidine phosphatase family protein [Nitrospiraceae bacterium]|nr:histidine phosphatase family protein [Nitrospiraceae bacterium]
MVTTLFLIRHGETEGSGTKRYKGHMDVALADKGIVQARNAAVFVQEYLKKTDRPLRPGGTAKLEAVYCSDLSRSVKSAEPIASPHGYEPIRVPDLRERNFGIWEDMSFVEIRELYPEEFNAWADNPHQFSPPGGESTLDLRNRVLPSFNRILDSHQGQCVAIVAHGGVNRVLLCHILGVPLENIFRIEQDYAAVNIIEFWDRYPVVKCMNHVSYGEYNNG